MTVSSIEIHKLAKFDSPTIANVIKLFDVVPRNRGFIDGRIRAAFAEMPPMVGFAVTASFRSDAPSPAGSDAYDSLYAQLEIISSFPGPSVVVFQDLDAPPAVRLSGTPCVRCTRDLARAV